MWPEVRGKMADQMRRNDEGNVRYPGSLPHSDIDKYYMLVHLYACKILLQKYDKYQKLNSKFDYKVIFT